MKAPARSSETLLEVRDLSVVFEKGTQPIAAVSGATFSVRQGEFYCLVGESGAGKSVTALSITQLVQSNVVRYSGEILFLGQNTLKLPEDALRKIRGTGVAYIFQEPRLNPQFSVAELVLDALRKHHSDKATIAEVIRLLGAVGIPDPQLRAAWRPTELSGGMQQRVMMAVALAAEPKLLIADEATAALDPTIESQMMHLLHRLNRETGMTILFITHNLGLLRYADRAGVMLEGKIIEEGPAAALLAEPKHPYTRKLLSVAPRLDVIQPSAAPVAEHAEPIMTVAALNVKYLRRSGFLNLAREYFHAVHDVSLKISTGESLGIIGESGAGKSSIARAVARLIEPASGVIRIAGVDVTALGGEQLRVHRRQFQIIFQDPFSSLPPTLTIAEIISEGLDAHLLATGSGRNKRIDELLQMVRLPASFRSRRPAELSGGQRRRLTIARALAVDPKLLIIDELSSLDLFSQAGIVELLKDLQRSFGLSYLLISHDLPLVAQFCHRVMVLRHGTVIESGRTADILSHPQNPYTRELISAVSVVRTVTGASKGSDGNC